MIKHEKISPLKQIKKHCLECGGGQRKEVTECPIPTCPLYLLRFGTNPTSARKKRAFSEAEKKAVADRLHKARSKKTH